MNKLKNKHGEDLGKLFVHELIEGYKNEGQIIFKSKDMILTSNELRILAKAIDLLAAEVELSNGVANG